jgi:hypothetical protein
MRTLALILVFGFTVTFGQTKRCSPARHGKIPRVKGLPYSRARKALLAAGWQPLKTNSSPSDANVSSGNGALFWRRGYIELETCSGTGVAACAFLFTDRFGNRLRVTTEGEELPKDKAHAHVNGTRFACD